ncbi:DUF2339 domain-containing protein [Cronobacter malonaticus]|uniref:DUF2339 domain-containing protein n=1 Tax=Cronobacter malonaticus TaxID=413503 RepID=UPI00188D14FD|nr:DUF2339 domain-containing protein [Cronobacter malonaticus]MBF4661470.1 DUF2339 domain-containing protein [Cronobacter malonaticus]MBF4837445.1 DUF2339 domain-containing protein [Cronobacter malonaticus]MBF4845631.1 DUF2339 domain-containing protein [Cronobacter malonaticus]MBF4849848.1 DUF2339 domain-containing protein [Cronobacter malonaticus]MBF4862250.1 DUF2339 domain-containing protein [Cronobacter malonaticus]
MDEIFVFAALIALFCVVVVPVIAIMALKRSARNETELHRLRNRIETLEARLAAASAPPGAETVPMATPAAEPAPVFVAPEPEPVPETAAAREPEPVPQPPADAPPVWSQAVRNAAKAPAPAAATRREEPAPEPRHAAASGGMLTSLTRWFMQGNPLAKIGVILLFLGISFLLRYSVERDMLPLELRVAGAGVAALVLLAFGWRLRHKTPVYALILQGGAVGALYITIFGAFRLWQMLPMPLAFGLMLVVCAASVALAVLQRALSLAMLASLGGYLAPLLLSTGGGSHIALFSFYLLLSVGIAAVSVWQHWRELNLLGLLFTFGVAGLWGINGYQPDEWLSCQLFLIANILLFGVVCVALSLRAQGRKKIVDGVMLFAPPLVGFGMQYAITRHWTYGPAFSALGFGLVYLLLARAALRRYPQEGRILALGGLALGGAFVTLAIPLALSARWTALAWALEGLGLLWFGMQQAQRRMSYSGSALLALAAASAVYAWIDGITLLNAAFISAVLALCWLAGGWLWREPQRQVSRAHLGAGIAFWLVALLQAARWAFADISQGLALTLALLTLSALLWRAASRKAAWPDLAYAVWLLWPGMALMLIYQIVIDGALVLAGWHSLVWCLALPCALWLLRRDAGALPVRLQQGLHLSLFWMLLIAAGAETWWFTDSLPWGSEAWQTGIILAVSAAIVLLVNGAIRRGLWPCAQWPALYSGPGLLPVAPVLAFLLLAGNLMNGATVDWPYLPLINPLELGAGFALLAVLSGWRLLTRFWSPLLQQAQPWAPLVWYALLFWWGNGLVLRTLAWAGEIPWQFDALWASRLVQTTFALLWMLLALLVMVNATRKGARQSWFCGAGLLGVVIVKLMLVDSAGGGGLARAVAFIGVAVLVLIVGYFSPLPPKAARPVNARQGEAE